MPKIEFIASPAARGSFVSADAEGETTIKLQADATQVARVLPLLGFERGTLLKITVEST